MTTADDTTELLDRWRGGNKAALDDLMERHLERIRTAVRQRLGRDLRAKLESSDVVMDVVLGFLTWGPKFVPVNGAQFRRLMIRIVETSISDRRDWFSAKRRDMSRDVDTGDVVDFRHFETPDHDPVEALAKHETRALVRLALELIPARDRSLLVMHDWDGLGFDEIAARLEVKPDSARKAYRRAMAKLRRAVALIRQGEVDRVLEDDLGDFGEIV